MMSESTERFTREAKRQLDASLEQLSPQTISRLKAARQHALRVFLDCGACETRCPYQLPIRKLLPEKMDALLAGMNQLGGIAINLNRGDTQLSRGEPIRSFETQRMTRDGRTLDVWITLTALVDDANHPVGIATTERDVTASAGRASARPPPRAPPHRRADRPAP